MLAYISTVKGWDNKRQMKHWSIRKRIKLALLINTTDLIGDSGPMRLLKDRLTREAFSISTITASIYFTPQVRQGKLLDVIKCIWRGSFNSQATMHDKLTDTAVCFRTPNKLVVIYNEFDRVEVECTHLRLESILNSSISRISKQSEHGLWKNPLIL